MSAILGGLFNSRLNMKLREEKGYTYGAGAGFDMRRGAGPFSSRAAVNTEVTVPAHGGHARRARAHARHARRAVRLVAARDFLIGVFPLRFETDGRRRRGAGQPRRPRTGVDELIGYRANIEAVDVDDVAGRRPGRISTWTMPRSCSSATPMRSPRISRLPAWVGSWSSATTSGRVGAGRRAEEPGPVDDEGQAGPTAGAEDPEVVDEDIDPA